MSTSKHFDALPELTEDEALDLICALRYKHRFAGIILTPQDIRNQMTEYHFPEDARREPTDAEVDGVLASWEWNHLADVLTDHAWAAVNDAITESLRVNEEDLEYARLAHLINRVADDPSFRP